MNTFYWRQIPLRVGLLLALVGLSTVISFTPAAAQEQAVQPLLLASQSTIHRLGPDQPEGSAEFVVDDSNQLSFHLRSSDAHLVTSITTPAGEVVNPQTITSFGGEFVEFAGDEAGDVEETLFFTASGHHYFYTFPARGAGVYTVHFAASNSSVDEVVLARLIADSALAAALMVSENTLVLGDVAVLTAALFEGVNAVNGANVAATIYPPDEGAPPIELTLRDNGADADNAIGDGLYSGEFKPSAAGLYSVEAEMKGQTSGGLAYRRTATALFEVVAATTAPDPTVSDRVEDDNGNGLYERMVIDVGLQVQQAGRYRIFVELEASNGERVAASAQANLTVGTQSVPMAFAADELRELGIDGPFTIRSVEWLVYGTQKSQAAGRRFNLGTTQAYALSQWERPPIRLTGDSSDQAVDTNSNSLFDQLTVELGIEVAAGGEYHWTAQLEDGGGRAIGLAVGAATLMTGTNTIDLDFAGLLIGQNGRDGPYTITGLALYGDDHAFLGDGVAVTQAYPYSQFEGAATTTTVPQLIGVEQGAAENALAAAGLTVGVTGTLYSATIAVGSVLSQTPAAAVTVAEGYPVDLLFSLGPRAVKVPDIRKLSQENAQIVLETFGMTVGAISEQSSIEAQGYVLGQNPLPGVMQPEGSSVSLFVSRGDRVRVPNFQGLSEADAIALIQRYPLTVGLITNGFDNTVPAGKVFNQSPFAGAAAQPGTAIAITISQGRGVRVPDLLRLSETEARTALANGELRTGTVAQLPNATIPAGAVALQDPSAGTTVAVSSTVNLLLSAGPVALATTPQVNSTAPVNTQIIFTYDKAVDPAIVNPDTFAVHALQTGLLTGTFAVQGQNVHLTPNRRLKAGEVVYVTVTRHVRYKDGSQPPWPVVWQFQVAPPTASDAVFTQSGDFFVRASSAAVGDLDGDEDLDVFFSRGDDAVVLFNTGNGNLVMGDQLLPLTGNTVGNLEGNDTSVALGDLDHDGDLDAFVTIGQSFGLNNGKPDQVWFNDGAGGFTDSGQRLEQDDNVEESVVLGDLDGDGDLDAVTSGRTLTSAAHHNVAIWHNLGTGIFTKTQVVDPGIGHRWVLGDVDGDGDLDAIGVRAGGPCFVWLNSGLGKFVDSGQRFGNGVMVALGDIDSDGDLDATVAEGLINGPGSKVFLNQGGSQRGEVGVFAESQVLEGTSHSHVDLADVDGDGDLDAIFQQDRKPNEIWRNDGNGVFTRRGQMEIGQFIFEAYFGDMDGDGTVDAFVTYIDSSDNEGDDRGTVLLNKIPAEPAQQRLNLPTIRR